MDAGKELDGLVERYIFGFVWDEKRCRICGWPLVPDGEVGCWDYNCALRPPPKARADEPTPFSTDDAQAFRLLMKMQDLWTDVTIESAGAQWHVSTPISGDSDKDLKVALCNAALKSAQIPVTGFDSELGSMTMNCALETGTWPNAYIPTEDIYRDRKFFLMQAREHRVKAAEVKALMGAENYPCGTFTEGYYRGLAMAYRSAASMLRFRIRVGVE